MSGSSAMGPFLLIQNHQLVVRTVSSSIYSRHNEFCSGRGNPLLPPRRILSAWQSCFCGGNFGVRNSLAYLRPWIWMAFPHGTTTAARVWQLHFLVNAFWGESQIQELDITFKFHWLYNQKASGSLLPVRCCHGRQVVPVLYAESWWDDYVPLSIYCSPKSVSIRIVSCGEKCLNQETFISTCSWIECFRQMWKRTQRSEKIRIRRFTFLLWSTAIAKWVWMSTMRGKRVLNDGHGHHATSSLVLIGFSIQSRTKLPQKIVWQTYSWISV